MKINNLTDTDAAYLAGIIDGEGSINLSRVHKNSPDHTTTYFIRLRVTNTHRGLLDWIVLKVGYGSVGKMKNYDSKYNRKQAYQWNLSNQRVVDVLRQVYPYLKVKRLQAEVAFEYQKTVGISFGKKLSEEIVDKRAGLKSKITGLNR